MTYPGGGGRISKGHRQPHLKDFLKNKTVKLRVEILKAEIFQDNYSIIIIAIQLFFFFLMNIFPPYI